MELFKGNIIEFFLLAKKLIIALYFKLHNNQSKESKK